MKLLWKPGNHTAMLLVCTLVMVGALLIYATGLPVGNLAPLAMLILCPLMHILMMRGHGTGDSGTQESYHGTEPIPVASTAQERDRVGER